MSSQKTCDHCKKVIPDPDFNTDTLELVRWEGEGGPVLDETSREFTQVNEDFCDMKCLAKFATGKVLEKVNASGGL